MADKPSSKPDRVSFTHKDQTFHFPAFGLSAAISDEDRLGALMRAHFEYALDVLCKGYGFEQNWRELPAWAIKLICLLAQEAEVPEFQIPIAPKVGRKADFEHDADFYLLVEFFRATGLAQDKAITTAHEWLEKKENWPPVADPRRKYFKVLERLTAQGRLEEIASRVQAHFSKRPE